MPSREGNNVVAVRTDDLQRLVIAACENFAEFGSYLQKLPRPGELDTAVAPVLRGPICIRS